MIKKIEGYLDEGYKRIKIKIAPGNDIEFIKAVRKNFLIFYFRLMQILLMN
ncbi:MAG: hypothetical protein M5T52_23950 [Ignavibacteriaceae bacterium]|nr:hypothetical protein [Ignavibacteriaceae bacterium]